MVDMTLGEKLRRLREAEGMRRGLWRPLTQRETVRALREELGVTLSQAYLSQVESGARVHLSNETREALARFYHIRPSDLTGAIASQDLASDPTLTSPILERLAEALQRAADPQRALRLLERLVALEPEALAALEARLDTALEARLDTALEARLDTAGGEMRQTRQARKPKEPQETVGKSDTPATPAPARS